MAEEKTQFKDVLGSFGIDRGDLTMSNLPGFGMQLLDTFTPNALVKFLRENFGIESTEEEAQRLMEEQGLATGGRVGLQEGGEAGTYQDIVDDIIASYPTGADSQTITRPSPQVEALQNVFGPQLASFLGTPISAGEGGQNLFGQTYGAFTPEAQAQNLIQQQAIQQALGQAGVQGTAQFDPTTQEFTGISGLGQGVAGFQPFLNQAQQAANLAQTAATQGQGAGTTALQNAADQANVAGLAALAGQNVGQPGITAAQNIADRIQAESLAGQSAAQPFLDRAAELSGPGAFQEFMSPYQQEVIDTTRQELERQLQAQQAKLGASAGSAFGGGRFGVAQGELGARGATGIAQTLAGLRQTGFEQGRQGAANALQQQLALGQAAQGQAGQNLALLGSGLQGQLATSQAAQQQAGQNVGLLGQTGAQQLGVGQGQMAQAGQNVGLATQAAQGQAGLAQLQPQLAAQNIGMLGQIGAQQQAFGQGLLDTSAAANQMIALMPQQQLGFFGGQVTGMGGGASYPTTYTYSPPVAGPSPLMQTLGTLGSVGGTIGGIASLYR